MNIFYYIQEFLDLTSSIVWGYKLVYYKKKTIAFDGDVAGWWREWMIAGKENPNLYIYILV